MDFRAICATVAISTWSISSWSSDEYNRRIEAPQILRFGDSRWPLEIRNLRLSDTWQVEVGELFQPRQGLPNVKDFEPPFVYILWKQKGKSLYVILAV